MPVELTARNIAFGAGVFVLSAVVTTAIVTAFLVGIRPDHFVVDQSAVARRFKSVGARIAYTLAKNLLGVVLVCVGVVLSLPGVPGQGLLTILVGLVLLDIPSKRRFELRQVSRPRVLSAINRLRARFGKAPLVVDTDPPSPADPPP